MSNKVLVPLIVIIVLIMLIPRTIAHGLNKDLKQIEGQRLNHLLLVKIGNIKQIKGDLHYQLLSCNLNKSTIEELTVAYQGKIKVETSNLTLLNLHFPQDNYALRLFQDLNANQKLDLSPNTIPIEPVGFSNNPSLAFGLPKLEKICFNLNHNLNLNIKLKNKRKRKKFKRQ